MPWQGECLHLHAWPTVDASRRGRSRPRSPRRKTFFLGLLVAFVATRCAASDSSMDRSTLRGLKAVKVVVDSPAPEIEREGISGDGLRITIEQKLRDAGITVDHDAVEFLGLNISSTRPPRRLISKTPISLVISIGLFQIVVLNRDKTTKTVTETWGDQRVAPPSKAIERTVSDAVDDLVNEFITAYRAVNPKP
jgi:hypothetical protein